MSADLVIALAAVVAAIVALIVAVVVLRHLKDTKRLIEETKDEVRRLDIAVQANMRELLDITAKIARAAGIEQARKEAIVKTAVNTERTAIATEKLAEQAETNQ